MIVRPDRPWIVSIANPDQSEMRITCRCHRVETAINMAKYERKHGKLARVDVIAAEYPDVMIAHDVFDMSRTVSESAPAWAALEMQRFNECGY